MSSSQLPNYVRLHRKSLGLSQDDVAFLLGGQSGSKVCRYEQFIRSPGLETVFAFEAVFGKPASEIFRGLYHAIEKEVAIRARTLALKPVGRKPARQRAKRFQSLAAIANRRFKKPSTNS